jgi:hypothetical protein
VKICPIVSIIEANLDTLNASAIARMIDIASGRRAIHMRHQSGGRDGGKRNKFNYGVWMDHRSKYLCMYTTRSILKSGKIQFHERVLSVASENGLGLHTTKDNMLELFSELRRYSRVTKEATSYFQEEKCGFTGKIGGDDDVCVTLQMLVFFPVEFYENSLYHSSRMASAQAA